MQKLLPIALWVIASQASAHPTIVAGPSKTKGFKEVRIERSVEYYSLTDDVKKKLLKSSGKTSTRVSNASGRAKENIRMDSEHSYEICNTEQNANYFRVNYEIKDQLYNSNSQNDNVYVPGKTCARGNARMFVVGNYPNAGTYSVYAYTDTDGVNRSSDSARVYISAR